MGEMSIKDKVAHASVTLTMDANLTGAHIVTSSLFFFNEDSIL